MSQSQAAATSAELDAEAPVSSRLRDYFQLTKPRLNLLVLTTTFVGYFMASGTDFKFLSLVQAMLGTAMIAGGASALNMYVERERDALMDRTASRPLPQGRVSAAEALALGVTMGAVGTAWLYVAANPLTALLGALTLVVYVLMYTPMKVRSTFNTAVGAIAGALPPVMGWTAVTGTLDVEAGILFAILFLWQHPHFFALAWMYKQDYAEGGYKMLPVIDEDGALSGRLMIMFSLALIPVSLSLTLTGTTGAIYAVGALGLGLYMLAASVRFIKNRTVPQARKVFRASLVYLPALLALLMFDRM